MMIGTNDPGNNYSVSQTTANIASIISTVCADDPGVKFLLGTITPRTDNSSTNSTNLIVNAALAGIVAQDQNSGDNVALVDLTTNFPSGGLSSDNLHPDDTGYAWMASQWYNAILAGATNLPATSALPINSPTTVALGATLDLDGTPATLGPLSGAGSVLMGTGGGLTINSGYNSTFSGSLSGPSGLTKIGLSTQILSGSNTYTGATSINAGTLALGASGSIAASPMVSIVSGAYFDVTALPGGYTVPAGQTITGAGTVSVAAGTPFALNSGAVLAAPTAGAGALTVNGGTLVLNTGSQLSFSATTGSNSQINVTGALDLAGPGIGVTLYQAGTNSLYSADGSYTLMTYGSIIGSTNNLFSYSPSDLSKTYSYNATSGSLTMIIGDTPVWTGNSSSSANWSDSGNWSNAAAPIAGQALVFAGSNNPTNTNDMGSLQAGGLQFSASAGSYNLSGGTIQISNALNNFSANNQTIGLNIQLASNLSVGLPAGPITITAPISDGGAGYGITTSGSGTLVLLASNTYTGATTIGSGTLQLGNGSVDGSVAGNIVNNSALVLQPATTITLNGAISGTGSVSQTGPGSTVFANVNTYSGATTVSAGTLSIPNIGSLNGTSGVAVSGGYFNLVGAVATAGVTTASGGTFNVAGGLLSSTGGVTAQSAGLFNMSAGLVNGGSGITAQSGGLFNISGGTVTTTSVLASGGSITVTGGQINNASSLITQAGGQFSVSNITLSLASNSGGVFGPGYGATGTGTVTVGSGGVLNVGTGGARAFIGGGPSGGPYGTGILNVNAGGSVNVAAGGAFPNDQVYLAGYGGNGTLNLSGTLTSLRNIVYGQTGTASFNFNGGTLIAATNFSVGGTIVGSIQDNGATINTNGYNVTFTPGLAHGGVATIDGGLTKVGSGTLALGGANTFTGPLTINTGTVTLPGGTNGNFLAGDPSVIVNSGCTLGFTGYNSFGANAATMSPVTVNGGTILSSGYVTCFNNLTLNNGTASVNGNDNYSSGWGSFGFAGTTTATGNSMINVISGNGTIANGDSYTPTFTVLTPAATDSLSISPVMQNGSTTLSLVKQGNGLLTLRAANTYTGGTTVSGGTLQLGDGTTANGNLVASITNNAAMVIANPAAQTFNGMISGNGSLTKTATGTLVLSAPQTYTGPTAITGGVLKLSGVRQTTVSLSGWNCDIIAEKGAANPIAGTTSNYAFGGGSDNWVWYENGAPSTTQGLATGGLVTSQYGSHVQFQLQPYTASNVLDLHSSTGTLTLSTPGKFSTLQFLDGMQGGASWTPTLHFSDGSSDTLSSFTDPDWTVSGNNALTSVGLVNRTATWAGSGPYTNSLYLFEHDVSLSAGDQAKTLQSISFGNAGVNLMLFAVSGVNFGSGSNLLPTTTALTISASSTFDLGGFNQQVASLGDYSATSGGGSIINSATGTTSLLTLQTSSGSTTTYSGLIAGTSGTQGDVSLAMSGSGTQVLTGNNTYTGGTTITSGTLKLGNSSALGSGNLAANSGTLDLAGNSILVPSFSGAAGTVTNSHASTVATLTVNQPGSTTFSGAINDGAGQVGLYKNGAGILTLANSNAYSGPTTVANGVLSAGASYAFSPNSAVTVSGTLDATAGPQTIQSLIMGGGGQLNLSATNLLTAGSVSFAGTLDVIGFGSGTTELIAYSSLVGSGSFSTVEVNNGPLSSAYNLIYANHELEIVPSGPPSWASASSGSWNNGNNWSGGSVPSAPGQQATLNAPTIPQVTITLDTPQTLGTLILANSQSTTSGYTLAPGVSGTGSLTMATSDSSTAQIIVSSGSHSITAAVTIANGDLEISASNNGILTISGNMADDNGLRSLTLDGDGTGELVLSGTNSFGSNGGGTIVTNGTLILTNNETLAAGSSLTIGDASAFSGGPGGAGSDAAGSAASGLPVDPPSITPVPEPGTLVLVAAGVIAGFTTWRRSSGPSIRTSTRG